MFKASTFEEDLIADDFEAVQLLNSVFNTDDSLQYFEDFAKAVDTKIEIIDMQSKDAVRHSAANAQRAQSVVKNTQNSIEEISKQISALSEQAQQTQDVVSAVCGSMKSYDNAKTNITETITCHKRLQMSFSAVTDLEKMVLQKNYTECARLILALSTLLEYFEKFEPNELLTDILNRYQAQKEILRNAITKEFEDKLFSAVIDSSVGSACDVVDAFGDEFRKSKIDWFCKKYLEPYQKQYSKTPLEDIDKRYKWLKEAIDRYKRDYLRILPVKWRMPYWISYKFCEMTQKHIKTLLSQKKPTLAAFTLGFEKTANMERILSESFAKNIVNEKGETEWQPNDEFIGLIGCAFSNQVDLYLQEVKTSLDRFIVKAKDGTRKLSSIDKETKFLKSGLELVNLINGYIQKCAGFHHSSALYQLFFPVKNSVLSFCTEVYRMKPPNMCTAENITMQCAMANTTEYFMSIISGLEQRVKVNVSDTEKSGIRVDDITDGLNDLLRKQIVELADGFCSDLLGQNGFLFLKSGQWMHLKTDDQERFPSGFVVIINQFLPCVRDGLSETILSIFISQFMKTFVDQYYEMGLAKKFVANAIENFSLGTDTIEKAIINVFQVRKPDVAGIIRHFFEKIRIAIKVSLTPDSNALTSIYTSLAGSGANAKDLGMILNAKGLSSDEINKIIRSLKL